MYDLIIIGGGAAGLWAAGTAARRGKHVLVLEKNKKAGVKILMSGGTRCNITHDCDVKGILDAFTDQGRFLRPALHTLKPTDVVAEFHSLGVLTKVEASGKVFPVSDRALDVRDALVRRLASAGARMQCGVAVESFVSTGDHWEARTGEETIECKKVLLCSGGLSYPGCGTTGDGYAWSRNAGHVITETYPALTPLVSPASWAHELSGLTLPDIVAQVVVDGKRSKDRRSQYRGGYLWTHFGCSGPVPMNVSKCVSELDNAARAELHLDLLPDFPEASVEETLLKLGGRQVSSFLAEQLPRRMVQRIFAAASTDPAITGANLPKKARQQIIENTKRMRLPMAGTKGYAKAEVTSGGVDVKDVNPKTMESRVASGLYFAGEVLNVDGPIGGFNFQAAFSTGHLAALNV
ncbi:MAG: aminoacetone oxidase family FAD-binding enzyme [Aureliella sp.]